MLVVSASGVGAATALTREAQPMATSMGEQAEEGTSGAPVVGVARTVCPRRHRQTRRGQSRCPSRWPCPRQGERKWAHVSDHSRMWQ